MVLLRKTPLSFWPVAAFIIPLALYLLTLAPSVTFYDSGEFISATYHLGSAHSPGYPLFMLFAKPFTWLPLGSLAFRVNLATACAAAMACFTVFAILKKITLYLPFSRNREFTVFASNSISLAGSLLFATSPRLWLQSNHDKPYPLLASMVAISFLFFLNWREQLQSGDENPSWLYGAAFMAGVASGAHQTIVLFIPGWTAFVLLSDRGFLTRARDLILGLFALFAGATVQLYLPVRASVAPPQNWGDTSSFSRFIWHVLRRGYPEDPHGRDWGLLFKQLSAFSVPDEFGWIGLLLLFVGFFAIWKINRPLLISFLISLLCYWSLIVGFFNPQADSIFLTEEFYTPLYLLSAVLISAGFYRIAAFGVEAAEEPEQYGRLHYTLMLVFFMMLPFFQLAANFRSNNQSFNYVAHDYAVNTLRVLPEDSVLFTWGDSGAFPLWYLQGVEKFREDTDLLHIPHLPFPWYRKEFSRITRYFPEGRQADAGAEFFFAETASKLLANRPVLIDYSTRHSISFAGDAFLQYGPVFIMEGFCRPPYCSREKVWDSISLKRLALNAKWEIDADTEKAIMIFAHSLLQSADESCKASDLERCSILLKRLEAVAPVWKKTIENMRNSYGLHDQSVLSGGV